MLRGGAAAAAQNACAGLFELFHLPGELAGTHAVDRAAVALDHRKPRVGLGDERQVGVHAHPLNHAHVQLRALTAVHADGVRAQRRQGLGRLLRVAVEVGRAHRVQRQRAHHGQVAHRADGLDGRAALGHAHHRLQTDQIHARVHQQLRLFAVDLDQFIVAHAALHVHGLAAGGHVSGDEGPAAHRVPGELYQRAVHLRQLVLQAVHRQAQPVCAEAGRVDDLAARVHVGALQILEHRGVLQHPLLGAHAHGHAAGAQVGAGRAVQNHRSLAEQRLKFTSGHSFSSLPLVRLPIVPLSYHKDG